MISESDWRALSSILRAYQRCMLNNWAHEEECRQMLSTWLIDNDMMEDRLLDSPTISHDAEGNKVVSTTGCRGVTLDSSRLPFFCFDGDSGMIDCAEISFVYFCTAGTTPACIVRLHVGSLPYRHVKVSVRPVG